MCVRVRVSVRVCVCDLTNRSLVCTCIDCCTCVRRLEAISQCVTHAHTPARTHAHPHAHVHTRARAHTHTHPYSTFQRAHLFDQLHHPTTDNVFTLAFVSRYKRPAVKLFMLWHMHECSRYVRGCVRSARSRCYKYKGVPICRFGVHTTTHNAQPFLSVPLC